METLAPIKSCATTACAFNNDGCTAPAVTVNGEASCATFISLDVRGSLPTAKGAVGVCQQLECVFNKDLACTNEAVVFADSARCESYTVR